MEQEGRRLKGIPEPPVYNAVAKSAAPTKFRITPLPIRLLLPIVNPPNHTVPSPKARRSEKEEVGEEILSNLTLRTPDPC